MVKINKQNMSLNGGITENEDKKYVNMIEIEQDVVNENPMTTENSENKVNYDNDNENANIVLSDEMEIDTVYGASNSFKKSLSDNEDQHYMNTIEIEQDAANESIQTEENFENKVNFENDNELVYIGFSEEMKTDINDKPSRSLKGFNEKEGQKCLNTIEKEHDADNESMQTETNSENKVNHGNDSKGNDKGFSEEMNIIRPCDPCLFDNVKENANSFCVVCVEYLCKDCARDHRRSKATRNHKVLIETEMPNDPKMFKIMKSFVLCSEHPEMEVSFKCQTHMTFICTRCLVVTHRKCEDVTEISNKTSHKETSVDKDILTSLPDELQSVHEMTISVRNAKEENIRQLQIDNSCIQGEQTNFIQSLQEQLLKLDEKSKSETETILTKALSELEEDIDRCKKIEMKEIEQTSLLDVALKYGNSTEVNMICEKVEKSIQGFKDETMEQKAKQMVTLKFERNQSFKDIDSIGSVSVENCKNDEENSSINETVFELSSEELREESLNSDDEKQQRKPLMQSSVGKCRYMYDIQSTFTKTTEKCSVSSILTLSGGTVVLMDYSNERLKVLNSDFTIRIEKELQGRPLDMCKYSGDKLATIIDGVKCIQKYSIIGENMCYDGEFPCKLYPISIGSIHENEDQVVILFSDETKKTPKKTDYDKIEIQIRSMNKGHILKILTDFKTKSSRKMVLENPAQICNIPNTQNGFLISEDMKLHFFETGQAGTVLKEAWYYKSYKGNILAEITDIAVDKNGNIYVCGKDSRNIHQISGVHYMNNRVLCAVNGSPISLCVDDENRQIIVGCEEDDFIYVIKLE